MAAAKKECTLTHCENPSEHEQAQVVENGDGHVWQACKEAIDEDVHIEGQCVGCQAFMLHQPFEVDYIVRYCLNCCKVPLRSFLDSQKKEDPCIMYKLFGEYQRRYAHEAWEMTECELCSLCHPSLTQKVETQYPFFFTENGECVTLNDHIDDEVLEKMTEAIKDSEKKDLLVTQFPLFLKLYKATETDYKRLFRHFENTCIQRKMARGDDRETQASINALISQDDFDAFIAFLSQ